MLGLTSPRHTSTLPTPVIAEPVSFDRDQRPMSALAYFLFYELHRCWARATSADCHHPAYARRRGGKVRRNRPKNRGHRWYRPDLNIEQDRAYLIGRGFTYAVVARGEKRGRVVSAHSSKGLADRAAKHFGGKNPPEVVEIATLRFGRRPTQFLAIV
jgi:hypothetical protein